MRIIGTKKEIAWVLEALSNGCEQCPYMEPCNTQAEQMQAQLSKSTENTCIMFLNQILDIEYIEE